MRPGKRNPAHPLNHGQLMEKRCTAPPPPADARPEPNAPVLQGKRGSGAGKGRTLGHGKGLQGRPSTPLHGGGVNGTPYEAYPLATF